MIELKGRGEGGRKEKEKEKRAGNCLLRGRMYLRIVLFREKERIFFFKWILLLMTCSIMFNREESDSREFYSRMYSNGLRNLKVLEFDLF